MGSIDEGFIGKVRRVGFIYVRNVWFLFIWFKINLGEYIIYLLDVREVIMSRVYCYFKKF